ncbi:MAG: RNA polymerase sigma-70 factor [Chitinophagaceae bacterium]|nr:RNA polymerase sigma-70 factor [Chitinophagaceae bacterium]
MNDCTQAIQVKIAAGDQKAFARLYSMYRNKLCRFAYTLIHSKEIAEEIIEDIFVTVWNNRETLTSIENLPVYLYVSVKNRSLNELSRKAKELITAPYDFLDFEIDDEAANPQDMMITNEMLQFMQKAVNTLPPRCKMIFKLVREDGLKYKEVSQILNISINTIDVQMAIAVKRICQSLQVEKKKNFRFLLSRKSSKIDF